MTDKTTRCSYDNIGSTLHAAFLLFVSDAIITSINSYTAYIAQVIRESLHGLVNLLGQLSGW